MSAPEVSLKPVPLAPHGRSGKVYFASDFHLGAPDYESSRKREDIIVRWLEENAHDMCALYLLGDLFDYWFEYRHVVPKGYIRLLGALAKIADSGVPIALFTGNHDQWMGDYLAKEVGLSLYTKPQFFTDAGKLFYLAHGDGLGPGDKGYKFIKKVFSSTTARLAYRKLLHPDRATALAAHFSKKSRVHTATADAVFLGEEKEWLFIHSNEMRENSPIDYFIYGHRHFPLLRPLSKGGIYCNLGDWINHYTFATWDGYNLELQSYKHLS